VIYFIQAGEGGPIKIGYTGSDPRLRLSSLQSMSPSQLAILAVIEGTEDDEHALHLLLRQYRIRREWFQPHEVVFAMMQEGSPFALVRPKKKGKIMIWVTEEFFATITAAAKLDHRKVRGEIEVLIEEALAARAKKAKARA